MKQIIAFLLFFTLLNCGSQSKEVIPRLPGDGTQNLSKIELGRQQKPMGENQKDAWSDATLIEAPNPEPIQNVETPPTREFLLSNGLKVIAIVDPNAPVVSMQLALGAGGQGAKRDQVGLAELTANTLLRGTKSKSAKKIADTIEFVGGELSVNAGFEATLLSCRVKSSDSDVCSSLVSELIAEPTFTKNAIDIERKRLVQSVLRQRNDAGALADLHFQHAIWGSKHVRGWPMSAETLQSISRADVLNWYKSWFHPPNAVLVVSGAFELSKLKSNLESKFRRWKKRKTKKTPVYKVPELKGIKVVLVDKPGQPETHLRVGHIGVAHSAPDFYAATLVNDILGGKSPSSRLVQALDSNAVSSHFDRNKDSGVFVVSTLAGKSETVQKLQIVLDQIKKMATEGPTSNELELAISHLAGGYSTKLSGPQRFANAFLAAELHKLEADYVKNYGVRLAQVSLDEARNAAANRLSPQDLVIVLVGDAVELEGELSRVGLTYEKIDHRQPVASWRRKTDIGFSESPVSKAELDKAKKILQMAMEAKGLKVGGIKSLSWTGTAELESPQGKVPATVKKRLEEPHRMRLDMSLSNGQIEVTTVVTKANGWVRQKNAEQEQLLDLPAAEASSLRAQVWRDPDLVLTRYLEKGTMVRHLGMKKFGGRTCHVISLKQGAFESTLYIAKKGFMLLGMDYAEQALKAKETYSDYRLIKGVQIAHKREASSAQSNLEFSLEDVIINSKISPLVFLKPNNSMKKKASE